MLDYLEHTLMLLALEIETVAGSAYDAVLDDQTATTSEQSSVAVSVLTTQITIISLFPDIVPKN